jgi:hypothetical protein
LEKSVFYRIVLLIWSKDNRKQLDLKCERYEWLYRDI